jgi:hypothetical protein
MVTYGNSIFAGTTSGACRSRDEGQSWSALLTGIEGTGVHSFAVVNSTLYAGTDSSFIYKWVEAATDVKDESPDIQLRTASLFIYPEPAGDELTLRFTTVSSGNTRVYAMRSSGEYQTLIADGVHTAGEHLLNVDTRTWASGVYCIVVQTETDVARKTVVVLR